MHCGTLPQNWKPSWSNMTAMQKQIKQGSLPAHWLANKEHSTHSTGCTWVCSTSQLSKKHHFHYWAAEWYSHDILYVWLDFLFGQNCSSTDFSVIGWDISFGILVSGYVISFWDSWCWNIVSKSMSMTAESLVFASSILFV